MFYIKLTVITFTSFALNLIASLDGVQKISFTEEERSVAVVSNNTNIALELNSAQLISIGEAMKSCYQDFLKSRTVKLPETSKSFDFFVHKKGKKYKIAKDGYVDLFCLERFLVCLSEDITCNESLKAAILELRTQRVNGNINKRIYTKALQEYGVMEESDIEQYLKSISHDLEKIQIVQNELNELKAKENEMRLKDLTFEKAFRYLPQEFTANPEIRNLAEAFIRENFPFTE